jgi:hypothetical protein
MVIVAGQKIANGKLTIAPLYFRFLSSTNGQHPPRLSILACNLKSFGASTNVSGNFRIFQFTQHRQTQETLGNSRIVAGSGWGWAFRR